MRTIDRTTQFKKDYKREAKGQYRNSLNDDFNHILTLLLGDQTLPEKYKDHPLKGDWIGYRDCHIKTDLVLIYQKINDDILELNRLGSHSELFG
jgi:mRNA interferase YafQ